MLPHDYLVDFARRKGEVPYPCYYCMNYTGVDSYCDDNGIVISFGIDGGVPCTCMAGLTRPTEGTDCKAIQLKCLIQHMGRFYPSSLFEKFSREYYMEMLTDLKVSKSLPRPMLIARALKGYHTREQRLSEMLQEGVIVSSFDIDNNEMFSLTEYGERIATVICEMLDEYLMIREQGELMKNDEIKTLFEWIRGNPNSTKRQIYDAFPNTNVELALEDLTTAGYVEPLFDNEMKLRYNTTQRGIDVWTANQLKG